MKKLFLYAKTTKWRFWATLWGRVTYVLHLGYTCTSFEGTRRDWLLLLRWQGSGATQLRSGGKYYLYFVGNFLRFPAVKKLWKSVKIWQSYSWLQNCSTFSQTQCRLFHFATMYACVTDGQTITTQHWRLALQHSSLTTTFSNCANMNFHKV